MTASDLPAAIGPYRNRIIGLRVMPVGELVDNPRNWRKHPAAQEKGLDAIMRQVGVIDVVRFNEPTGHLWDGHLRKKLFARDPDAPVVVLVTDLTADEEEIALATFDPLTVLAQADLPTLEALLDDVRELPAVADSPELTQLIYKVAGMAGIQLDGDGQGPAAQEDRAAELREQWGTELGQLWVIPSLAAPGRSHRLMCGDCTDPALVERLFEDSARAVLFATDPPYLIEYDTSNHPHMWNTPEEAPAPESPRAFDKAQAADATLYDRYIGVAVELAIAPNAAWYCWHASRNQAMVEATWQKHGAFVHQTIIWVKDRPILTRSWYMWQHEPCFFGWLKGHRPDRYAQDNPANVWHVPTVPAGEHTDHPTSKPVELFSIPIRQHTRPGDVCYEPFAGSGSQFVAAELLGRLVLGCEIAPEFVAVTLQRLADMGLQPALEGL